MVCTICRVRSLDILTGTGSEQVPLHCFGSPGGLGSWAGRRRHVNQLLHEGRDRGRAKVVLQQGQTSPYPATTDATGRSLIENVRDGAYSVRYEVDANFFPTRRSMSIQVPAGAASVRIEGRLVPLARISGRVIDPRGQVVADAVVELTTLPSFWTARTDPGITESMTNCPLSCLSPYPHTRYAGCS